MVLGYIIFFAAPERMVFIGPAGVLIFVGEAFIELLMLMFLADTVEYGQWKLGRRNESITFSVQPFINKIGAALATGIVMATTGSPGSMRRPPPTSYRRRAAFDEVRHADPAAICIVAGYLIYLFKYKIDRAMFERIISDLAERGDLS